MKTSSACSRVLQRPVSPVDARPLSPTPSEVVSSDSEVGADQEARAAKRRRIEQIAQQYLSGQGVFILSAGLRGPLDRTWKNPWRGVEKKRLPDGNAGGKAQRCLAAPGRKKQKTDRGRAVKAAEHSKLAGREIAKSNDDKRVLPLDNLSHGDLGVSEQQSQGIPATHQDSENLAATPRIPRANANATPPTETWLRRATTSCTSRNQNPVYGGATKLIFDAQAAPEPTIPKTISSLPQAPEPGEASNAAVPLAPPIQTGFTPINKSNELAPRVENVHTDLLAKTGEVDGNGKKPERRPRHVDFAAMSSPNGQNFSSDLSVTSKLKTGAKRQNMREESNAEQLAKMLPSKQEHTLKTTQPLTALHANSQQQEGAVTDTNGQPEVLAPPMVTPVVVPNGPRALHGGDTVPRMQTNQRESLEDLSTQVEILNAQRLFQAEIPSPGTRLSCPPELTPEHTLFGAKTGGTAVPRNADEVSFVPSFQSFSGPPHQDEANGRGSIDSQGTDVISTQELMDAASPFSFSTAKKKPSNGIFAKRASPIQTPSRLVPLAAEVEDGAFRENGPNMERSPEIEMSMARLQQGKERAMGIARQERTPTNAPTSLSPVPASSLPTSAISSSTIAKCPEKSDDLSNNDSEEELSNYIDDISNYLDVWDIEAELKRVAAPKPSGVPAVAAKGILSAEGKGRK
ncbi:MAG: hypothetical protein M1840_004227 [Geoglossum simile]|nr:MAG: hypothetical protein M1840_004227 [Geoglossum simile]